MRQVLEQLLSGKPLTPPQIQEIFAKMLAGELADVEIGAVLAAWRLRGEGADELYAGAVALRRHAAAVELPPGVRPLADNCGTGGDGSGSFNLSTAAAIVAASAGARVAKHGNRSVSSKCGSADLLFAAGFPEDLAPAAAGRLLAETGLTFFFAPSYHPVLKSVGAVRKALGVRTIFNLLGPLANPLAPEVQLIGVGTMAHLTPMAEALARLGVTKALVVHARDGLDELSPAALTDAVVIDGGRLRPLVIDPRALKVGGTLADLAGGDAAFNLAMLARVLDGDGRSPDVALDGAADAVALNAGAVLWLAGVAPDLAAGLALARRQISGNLAGAYFRTWLAKARALAS